MFVAPERLQAVAPIAMAAAGFSFGTAVAYKVQSAENEVVIKIVFVI